ncbi:MAG: 16S rRNA (cytosine(1402)-N(4))-methyltransferase, partial [Geobacteraceae bacterium]|nr:16S rRNA (cytosine(1402)-N(4))-methyltransferase [Geobacteraceae bacterium]
MEGFSHTTVLYNEVLRLLSPRPGGVYVDGTIGGGGHALGILQASSPDGILLGFDRDAEALAAASRRLSPFEGRVRL